MTSPEERIQECQHEFRFYGCVHCKETLINVYYKQVDLLKQKDRIIEKMGKNVNDCVSLLSVLSSILWRIEKWLNDPTTILLAENTTTKILRLKESEADSDAEEITRSLKKPGDITLLKSKLEQSCLKLYSGEKLSSQTNASDAKSSLKSDSYMGTTPTTQSLIRLCGFARRVMDSFIASINPDPDITALLKEDEEREERIKDLELKNGQLYDDRRDRCLTMQSTIDDLRGELKRCLKTLKHFRPIWPIENYQDQLRADETIKMAEEMLEKTK